MPRAAREMVLGSGTDNISKSLAPGGSRGLATSLLIIVAVIIWIPKGPKSTGTVTVAESFSPIEY
jgi:hypothetical protein